MNFDISVEVKNGMIHAIRVDNKELVLDSLELSEGVRQHITDKYDCIKMGTMKINMVGHTSWRSVFIKSPQIATRQSIRDIIKSVNSVLNELINVIFDAEDEILTDGEYALKGRHQIVPT